MRTPAPIVVHLLSVLLVAVVLAACTGTTGAVPEPGSGPLPVATPTPTAPTPDPTSDDPGDGPTDGPGTPSGPVLVASWDPAAAPLALPDGSTLGDCEGDVPALCVVRDGVEVGLLLHSRHPAPDGVADGVEGLRAFATERLAEVVADRAAGCGTDHVVTGMPPVALDVDGTPGLRYGFTTRLDGVVVEQVAVWAVVRDGVLDLVVAEATAAPGCMHGELTTFEPDHLAALLPTLDRVMAVTPLPAA